MAEYPFSDYFNQKAYLNAKTSQLNSIKFANPYGDRAWTEADTAAAIADAGLTPWSITGPTALLKLTRAAISSTRPLSRIRRPRLDRSGHRRRHRRSRPDPPWSITGPTELLKLTRAAISSTRPLPRISTSTSTWGPKPGNSTPSATKTPTETAPGPWKTPPPPLPTPT